MWVCNDCKVTAFGGSVKDLAGRIVKMNKKILQMEEDNGRVLKWIQKVTGIKFDYSMNPKEVREIIWEQLSFEKREELIMRRDIIDTERVHSKINTSLVKDKSREDFNQNRDDTRSCG